MKTGLFSRFSFPFCRLPFSLVTWLSTSVVLVKGFLCLFLAFAWITKLLAGLGDWLAGEAALVPGCASCMWHCRCSAQIVCVWNRPSLPESACGSGSCYSLLGICDFYLPISKFCVIAFPVQVYYGLNKNVHPLQASSRAQPILQSLQALGRTQVLLLCIIYASKEKYFLLSFLSRCVLIKCVGSLFSRHPLPTPCLFYQNAVLWGQQ